MGNIYVYSFFLFNIVIVNLKSLQKTQCLQMMQKDYGKLVPKWLIYRIK